MIDPSGLPSRLRRDESGAAAVMLAGSLFALVAGGAVAIDAGSLYLQHRQMQGLADAVALSAANGTSNADSVARAQALIIQSRVPGVTLGAVTSGHYVADPALSPDARFTTGPAGVNDAAAVRVQLRETVPLYFGAILTGRMQTDVATSATAARLDMAAFSIGTRLGAVSGGLPGAFLSALAGQSLGLGTDDIAALEGAPIDLLKLGDTLRVAAGTPNMAYGQVFSGSITLSKLVAAMATSAPDSGSRAALLLLAQTVGSGSVQLSDLVDLGPLARTDYRDASNTASIDALTLLRSALQLSRGAVYDVTLDTAVAGFSGVTLRIVGGPQPVHSPMMTVSAARGITISTSQTRIYLMAKLASPVSGLLTVQVPIYLEVARASAQLADIRCSGDPVRDGVTLSVTPSIGAMAIASLDPSRLSDFSAEPVLAPATLAQIPTMTVTGYSAIALGGATSQSVHFTRDDIANDATHTVVTNDLVTAVASTLVSQMQVNVSTPLGTLGLQSLVPNQVQGALRAAAPGLDMLLNDLTQTLGVPLGLADTRVDRMRCGVPVVV